MRICCYESEYEHEYAYERALVHSNGYESHDCNMTVSINVKTVYAGPLT